MLAAVSSVNRVYGVRLTVAESFGLRDVPALAREIERRRRPTGPGVDAAAAAAPRRATTTAPDRYPLSSRQLAYMWVCMAGGNANWCNISREIPVARRLAGAELGEALGRLLARHDALGLALAPDWQEQTWTAPEELSCAVREVDTDAGTDTPAFRECVQATRTELVAEPIDPEAAPAIRVALVRGSTGSSVVLVAHHLFVDGLGLDVLAGELRAALSGGPDPDDGRDTGEDRDRGDGRDTGGYRAFCLATAREEEPGPAAAYWRSLLDGATQVELPEATGPGGEQGELLSLPLGAVCTRRIHTIAQESGVSAFTVVLAAFERAVADTFGLDRPSVIVVSQNRGESDAAVVGNFTTSLIVRGPGAPSLRENIDAMASQLADGTRYGDWEFDQRIADLGLGGTNRFPLSTVLFNQRPMPRDLRARDLGAWSPRALGRALRYQLQGELQMSGPEMVMTYYYRRGISGADEIGRVHRGLLRAIRAGQEASRD